MTTTTTNSMNILLQKPTTMVSVKVPKVMKDMLEKAAANLNMNVSDYMRLVLNERLEKDIRA